MAGMKEIKYTPPKIQKPVAPAAPIAPYKAAAAPTALPQFDVLKGQASQRANAAGQQQEQALQRLSLIHI
jgi:hypothetical protein